MGIPHLSQFLEPFAVNTVLGCKTSRCEEHRSRPGIPRKLIIDGPGFAHYVYYRIHAYKDGNLNAFDAMPSYTEIGDAFIAFLHELEEYGLTIHAIFFDGYLPKHKQQIRLERLNDNRKSLLSSKAKHVEGFPISERTRELAQTSVPPFKLLKNKAPHQMHRGIPAAPFLVPAVLEAIAESKYASVTHVVAGEADAFCAVAARQTDGGTLVLSNDSDLLVYDLGPQAGLASFNRFKTRQTEVSRGRLNPCETIRTRMFTSRDVARRLGLSGLERLAYQIQSDRTVKLPEAVQRSRQPPANPTSLEDFLSKYDLGQVVLPTLDRVFDSVNALNYLDPRISELVHQVNDNTSTDPIIMYLPMLIEDPTCVSAWTETAEDRAFAYSCLNIYRSGNEQPRLLQEAYRKADGVDFTALNWLDNSETSAYASTYLNKIRIHMDNKPKHPRGETSNPYGLWRDYALSRLCDPPLTNESLKHILGPNENSSMWSWEDVQIDARLQSCLYSTRIMQQILRYLDSSGYSLSEPLLALYQTLETLPPLRVVMTTRLERIERGQQADPNPSLAPEPASIAPSPQPKPALPTEKSPQQKRRGEALEKNDKRVKRDERFIKQDIDRTRCTSDTQTFAFARRQLQSHFGQNRQQTSAKAHLQSDAPEVQPAEHDHPQAR